jgi:molybdate transport system substrate-binding protein
VVQRRVLIRRFAAIAGLALLPPAVARESDKPGLLVFAAASLTDVLGELTRSWEKSSGIPVKLSFAASSALARQIEAGSPADIMISADQEWMDYLAARRLVDPASRRDLAGNRLVLIAPADSTVQLRIEPGFPIVAALAGGRLATADPDTVPAGRYARSALTTLGVWDHLSNRLVRAENVRAALTYVARGEASLGIVYATDARIENKIRVVGTFPDNSHAAITYPAAATATARRPAFAYLAYLAGADAAAIWKRHGFQELRK